MLELSLRESRGLHHHYIGTEHILLGLVRDDTISAMSILQDANVASEQVRAAVHARLFQGRRTENPAPRPQPSTETGSLRRAAVSAASFRVEPDEALQRWLASGAARALAQGRPYFGIDDLPPGPDAVS